MDCDPLCEPMPPPELNLPDSDYTVDVRVMDTGTLLYLKSELFWQPKLEGFDGVHAPVYCFLVSHGDRHVVFDLGVRRDWENCAPPLVSLIRQNTTITMGTDIASMLDRSSSGSPGIRARDVEAIIWSHNHFDHTGDPTTFPSTTALVVGPGVPAASWPGYPTDPQGTVLDADAQGRTVREIAFHGERHLRIGRFDGFDYFGDGSFYLLDAPGHAVGHMCALARTAAQPPSFVLMGADACHHPGVLRPTTYLPLLRNSNPPFCPGELLAGLTKMGRPDTAFFDVPEGPIFLDHGAAMETVRKIQELDASEHVLVVLAHDLSLRQSIPLFPDTLNDWKERGLRPATRWLFLQDFEGAVKQYAAESEH